MSDIAIKRFYTELETLRHRSGNETSIQQVGHHLIDEYARGKYLRLVQEVSIRGKKGKNVTPDGSLKDTLVLEWGYWESKDEYDDLKMEIASTFEKGYPDYNTLFEDSTRAALHQNGIRNALEWILDKYKEKKTKDPTIASLFDTYRFADYIEQVIDLLMRVCNVSVKIMEIIRDMESRDDVR